MYRSTNILTCVLLMPALSNAAVAGAERPPAGAPDRPTCAVLPEPTGARPAAAEALAARAALLEARLAEGRLVTPVERAGLDRVLKEQQLAAAFGPEAGGRRVELGRLLDAELLVFLRTAAGSAQQGRDQPSGHDAPPAALDVVVSEAATGLRLSTGPVPLSADAEADARTVAAVVAAALAKYREGVKVICAVPPFVSEDLGYRFDHLKAAYAALVEQALLRQPGVLVVELAEARSIARELAVAGRRNIDRPAPLYLFGEYRHAGRGTGAGDEGAEPTVRLSLRLMRAEARLAAEERENLGQDAAAAFLADAPVRLLAGAGAVVPPRAADAPGRAARVAVGEAQQLAARADVFRRLGNAPEEAALREAALLLAPDDPDMRRRAAAVYGRLARTQFRTHQPQTLEERARAEAFSHRALEHLEVFLRTDRDLAAYTEPGGRSFLWDVLPGSTGVSRRIPSSDPKVEAMLQESMSRARAILLQIAWHRARHGRDDAAGFVVMSCYGLDEPAWRERLVRIVREMEHLPQPEPRAYGILRAALADRRADAGALFAALDEGASPSTRAAVAWARKNMEAIRPPAAAPPPAAPRPALVIADDGNGEVRFRPVTFVDDDTGAPVSNVWGVLPAGDGVDFVWTFGAAYVMKKPGRARAVWRSSDPSSKIETPCFDGRYVWVDVRSGQPGGPPGLLVIDPVAEKAWEVTDRDGLPAAKPEELPPEIGGQQYLLVAPTGVGRACVAGFMGRTWIADVTFDPAAGARVKVFHEARERADGESPAHWKSNTVAFWPTYMVTLADRPAGPGMPGKPGAAQRVLIGRGYSTVGLSQHPLVVDPATLKVDVLTDEGMWADNVRPHWAVDGGALYWVAPHREPGAADFTRALWRIGFPGPARTLVSAEPYREAERFESEKVAFHGGRAHLVARRWWVADAPDKAFRPLRYTQPAAASAPENAPARRGGEDMEPVEALFVSGHLGLLARRRVPDAGDLFFEVEFPE